MRSLEWIGQKKREDHPEVCVVHCYAAHQVEQRENDVEVYGRLLGDHPVQKAADQFSGDSQQEHWKCFYRAQSTILAIKPRTRNIVRPAFAFHSWM